MKLMVCGSRLISDKMRIFEELNQVNQENLTLISGGAKGVDSIAEKWAEQNNIPIIQFKPDWKRYGKSAGIIRNKQMVEESDFVLIFWNEISKGTKSDIEFCQKLNKPNKLVLL